MTEVALPALDGRTPLGFLAAVGLLRLLGGPDGCAARLSWSAADCTARLSGPHPDVEGILSAVQGIVERIGDGAVLPDLPDDLPPPGEAPDRLRIPREALAELVHAWPVAAQVDAWLSGLLTDLSVDGRGRVDITLLAAPSGKQSMRTMLSKPLQAVRERPAVLREAILGWRRYPGVTGEYLDHRVVFDAADAPDGRPRERGVPGATWLALMAFPVLPTTAVDGRPITAGWHRFGPRAGDRRLVYPLWTASLDLPAVSALLRHPLLGEAVEGGMPDGLSAFTVFRICRAQRRSLPGRTFAGVLAPVR